MKTSQSGFSLIELLVVLVILGLIAGLVVPNIVGRAETAKISAAESQIQALSNGVATYYLDNGNLPERLEDLVNAPGDAKNWNGPYVRGRLLKDPWGRPYEYRFPGQHGEYDIVSYGADGHAGGEGKNGDITSWE